MLPTPHGSALRRATIFAYADRRTRQLLRALEAIHVGFWLGLMDAEVLDIATQRMYERMSSYRQDDYNLSGLTYWEQAAIDRYFGGTRRILVAGAGGGREVIALAKQGMFADGFDPDPTNVACGNRLLHEQGLPGRLVVAEPNVVPEQFGHYDAALVGWGAYTHIPGRNRRIAFLRQLVARLPPGGHVLLSFFIRDEHARTLRLSHQVARAVSWLRFGRSLPELGDTFNGGYFHKFNEAEIRGELEAAGLRLLQYCEHPYGHAVGTIADWHAT